MLSKDNLTPSEKRKIEMLLLQKHEDAKAMQAFYDENKDVIKASDNLKLNKTFNPKVRDQFETLMLGDLGSDQVMELGWGMNLLGFDSEKDKRVEEQFEEAYFEDRQAIKKSTDQGKPKK